MASSKVLNQKELRNQYRTVCGYTASNGVTTDSKGIKIDRYPSEDVIRYVVHNAPKSAPLSPQDWTTIHRDAEIHVQTVVVQKLTLDASFYERSEASNKLESDKATVDAEKAAADFEETTADFHKLIEALKAAEMRVQIASLHNISSERKAKILLERYKQSSALFIKSQKQAAEAAEGLKMLTGT
jgi:hypothetical protein